MENIRRQAMKKLIRSQIIQQSVSEKELVKGEIAHTTKYGSLIENILDNMNGEFETWRKALSDQSNYSSKETACELLECIGEVLRDELKETLKNKKFSI
ncbi:hypothetical protein FQA39_LY18200 [Lamprigera yunnana]|nr:hypothetical protein FQA39_LY18200 [Lamprigera yunnana]